MYRLIESICVREGNFQRLPLHEARINRTLAALQLEGRWVLNEALAKVHLPPSGLFKCRVVYTADDAKVELQPYTIRPITSLKRVDANDLVYQHKWEDRDRLHALWQQRGLCDDVLIIKNGMVTDTFYANIVFRKGEEWFTPDTFLLPGTMREALLTAGIIRETKIRAGDLHQFDSFKLINALMEWNATESHVSNIH
ncbi:MAG: aminotransferase class IV [Bacteroidota bacterium]